MNKNIPNTTLLHLKLYVSFILLVFTTTSFSQDNYNLPTLSGPLPKLVTNIGKPYLVKSDIEVPFGKTVTIEPGVVFLFQNFTGFQVQGQLICEGTKDKPIIFTSEFDGKYHPDSTQIANPFDWNGVYIHKDAFGSRFQFCRVHYSVYGIKSDTRLIRLDPCIFRGNGKVNFTLTDSIVEISEGKPFSYVLSARDAQREGVSIKLVEDPQGKKRRFFRIGGGLDFLAGAAVSAYGYYRYRDSSEEFEFLSSDDIDNTGSNSDSKWNEARKDKNGDIAMMAVGAAAAVLGAVGFTVSFTF